MSCISPYLALILCSRNFSQWVVDLLLERALHHRGRYLGQLLPLLPELQLPLQLKLLLSLVA